MRQWLSRILVALLLVPGLGVVALDYASAGACRSESFVVYDDFGGVVGYQSKLVDCTAGETPASDPPVVGTSGPPPCDVASATPATFCWGSYPCYYTDSVVPLAPPPPPQPTPGAKWHVRLCLMPDGIGPGQPASASWHGEAQWVGQAPQPPPMIDQAREAFGQLAVPKAKLVFNPTARTLVNLDTWFWAQGLSGDELRGSSAFGLVAVATPDTLVITPGDGSAAFTCGWVTVKSDVCAYAYRRSSVGGSVRGLSGAPAYQASGEATWRVRFELNGVPVPIAGAPTVLTGLGMTAAVEVAEVQTIVTGVG